MNEDISIPWPDDYEPTSWVKSVVGKRYKFDFRVYECFAYDPRQGFWMRTVDKGEFRQTNVSERAIGRTFHEDTPAWRPS